MKKIYNLVKDKKTIGSVRFVVNTRESQYFAEIQLFDTNHYTGLVAKLPIKKIGLKLYIIEANSETELYYQLEKAILQLVGENVNMRED